MNQAMTRSSRNKIPTAKELNNPEITELLTPPDTAWLTIGLLFESVGGWMASGYLGITGAIPTYLAVAISAITAYWSFTVLHDASHRAVSSNAKINDLIGRIAIMPLIPMPIFRMFRFVHMQHHRFTNEGSDTDPDAWTSSGPKWQLPFRWATLDLYYFYYYLPLIGKRPADERKDCYTSVAIGVAMIATIIAMGFGQEFLLYWIFPSRFAVVFLALAFDYLPHIPKKATQLEDPFQATNNRIGLEWLLTPLLLFQNYHLVHHLYPRVPFYRYIKVWKAGEGEFKKRGALLLKWNALKE